jgi:hypothetical protein
MEEPINIAETIDADSPDVPEWYKEYKDHKPEANPFAPTDDIPVAKAVDRLADDVPEWYKDHSEKKLKEFNKAEALQKSKGKSRILRQRIKPTNFTPKKKKRKK